jgi:hypothetical protein
LGRRSTTSGLLEGGDRADLLAHQLTARRRSRRLGAVDAGLEHHEPQRQLALELVGDADDRALGDVRMRREHLLHAAGGEPVAGDVDDVVDAAHDEQVAVVVLVAGVAGQVVAGERDR